MPYLPTTDFASNLSMLQNPEQIKELTPTLDSGETQQSTTASQGVTTSAAQPETQSTVSESYSVKPATTGTAAQRVMSPASQQLTSTGGKLQDLSSGFYSAAGESRDYQSADIENYLRQAINPNATAEQKTGAKGYLSTSYQGPSGITPDEEGQISSALSDLMAYAKAGKDGRKLTSMMAQAMPGSQYGEQMLEAKSLMQDQGYMKQQADIEAAINEMMGKTTSTAKATRDYATKRTQEEADIASKSKDFLTGQKQAIGGDLQRAVSDAQAKQDAITKAWADYQAGGALPVDAEQFNTEDSKKAKEAQAKWDEILGRYGGIKDVPIMRLTTNNQARRRLYLPDEYMQGDAYKQLRNSPNWADTERQIYARQNELERYFAPYSAWQGRQIYKGDEYGLDAPLAMGEEGIYSKYKPLYFGPEDTNQLDTDIASWMGPDPSLYMDYDQGYAPSMANMATDEQRGTYNNIAELLGEQDRIGQDDPYREASISVDLQKFLDDEAANIKQWDEDPTKAAADWDATVKRAKKKLKEDDWQKFLILAPFPFKALGAMELMGDEVNPIGAPSTSLNPAPKEYK